MQIQLNNQFKQKGLKNYVIEDIISHTSKLTISSPTKKSVSDYSIRHKKLIKIVSDMTTCNESTNAGSDLDLMSGTQSGSNSP